MFLVSWEHLIFTLVFVLLVYISIFKVLLPSQSDKGKHLPPIHSGWIPWLGCALEFGKSPLTFIEQMRKQLGPVFTLNVAGERMTFLTEPAHYDLFFRSSNVDFQKAVQNAVQNIASITDEAFFKNHTKIHDMVKGQLAAPNLAAISLTLFAEFKKHLCKIQLQNDGIIVHLEKIVRTTMYKSVITNLFGSNVLPTDDEKAFRELENNLVIFDDQFEYGARLPPIFLRKWSAAKKWLLSKFSKVVSQCMKDLPQDTADQTLLQTLMCVVNNNFAPNWSVMLLWASLANAIPITFWTLALIYSHPHVLAKVQAEVDAALKRQKKISDKTLSDIPYARQCMLEAIRLHSPGIIARRVVQEFTVQGFTVPKGDLLIVSPYWTHRNPHLFPDPDVFKPERWETVEKTTLPEKFIAFGGGRYQCPGRWFALMEIHMYVILFVNMFDCKLLGGVPDSCKLHLVGTQQPEKSCPVLITSHKVH